MPVLEHLLNLVDKDLMVQDLTLATLQTWLGYNRANGELEMREQWGVLGSNAERVTND